MKIALINENSQAGKSLYCAMFNPPIKTLRL